MWDDGHVYSICNRHFSTSRFIIDDENVMIFRRISHGDVGRIANFTSEIDDTWWSSNEFWKLTTQGDFCKAFVLLSEKKEVLKDNRKWRWEISMTSKKSQKIIWRAGISFVHNFCGKTTGFPNRHFLTRYIRFPKTKWRWLAFPPKHHFETFSSIVAKCLKKVSF